jgi:hypothetical protein
MLGWLPIVGPIIDGIVSIFTKVKDTEVQKYNTDGTVTIEKIKASQATLETFKSDIGVRLCRDLVIFFPSLWCALIGWDTLVSSKWPELMWHVNKYPDSLSYLPGAVLTFLLGNTALNIWARK